MSADREDLEDRVDELESKMKRMLPNRRDVVKGGLLAGAAGLSGFGAGSASASGHNDGDTQWGTSSNRDDYFVDYLDANKLDADEQGSTVESLRTYHVAPSQSWGYDSIQAAVDQGEADWGSTGFRVEIHEEISENTVEVAESNVQIVGRGTEREGIGNTAGININVGGAPGIRFTNNNAPAGSRVENLVIGGAGGSPAIHLPNGAVNFTAEIQAVSCGSAFQIDGGSNQENDLNADARNVDVGLDLDFSNGGFFNQNQVNLDVAKYNVAGIRCDTGTDGEFVGNTFPNIRIENSQDASSRPIEVTGSGYFKDNRFEGYGIESADQEWLLDANNMEDNIWLANITPNAPFTWPPDMGVWAVFHARSQTDAPFLKGTRYSLQTEDVSTTAKTILPSPDGQLIGGLVTVNGTEDTGADEFYDVVHYSRTAGLGSVVSQTDTGSASRTYTTSAGDLQLAMGSGTYDVVVGSAFASRVAN